MGLDKITLWAGIHGPCLTIASFQWIIIWKLIKQFFSQQKVITEIRLGIDTALLSISEGKGQ